MAEPKLDTKVSKEPTKVVTEPKPASPPPKPSSPKIPAPPVESKEEAESSEDKDIKQPEKKVEKKKEKKDLIDMGIFSQILELDDDDECEFSKEMVWQYFSQVRSTFKDMDSGLSSFGGLAYFENRESEDLKRLSELGHFLKGSSAALGVIKVQDSCTKIQHYGELRDEEKDINLKPADALSLITDLLAQVKQEYDEAEQWLKDWYKEHSTGELPVVED